MKAILEFDLPEDEESFEICQMGPAYLAILRDYDEKLRAASKYEDDEAAAKWRTALYATLAEYNVVLWR